MWAKALSPVQLCLLCVRHSARLRVSVPDLKGLSSSRTDSYMIMFILHSKWQDALGSLRTQISTWGSEKTRGKLCHIIVSNLTWALSLLSNIFMFPELFLSRLTIIMSNVCLHSRELPVPVLSDADCILTSENMEVVRHEFPQLPAFLPFSLSPMFLSSQETLSFWKPVLPLMLWTLLVSVPNMFCLVYTFYV